MPPTLILSPRSSSDSNHLWKAAMTLGWKTHRAMRLQPPEEVEDPTLYGELYLCDILAGMLDIALLEPSNNWLAELPEEYLKRRVQAMDHEGLPAITERKFIKPANDKVFEAGVYERGEHVPWHYLSPKTPVLVSDVVSFDIEVRCYVLDRKLVTAGVYAGTTHPDQKVACELERAAYEGALVWTQRFLDDPRVDMPSALVVDVGFISNVGWAVVEANQAYCSGIYTGGYCNAYASPGADPLSLLPVIKRSASLRSQLRPEDEKWVRNQPGG